MIGIYKITNIINNKVYIGQSIDIERRIKEHIRGLNGGYAHNPHFQNSWNKYGEDNFKFEVLEVVDDTNKLDDLEIYYIDKYNSKNNGYNCTIGGNNPLNDEEYKKEFSLKMRGGNSTLSCDDVRLIKLALYCQIDRRELSKMFNVSTKVITGIAIGKSFYYVCSELNERIHNLKARLIDDRNLNILKLFDSGLGITEISNETELSVSVVEKCVYKYRDAVSIRKNKYKRIYDECHRLHNDGYINYDISKILNISPSSVQRYLTNFSNPYEDPSYKKITKNIENEILKMYINDKKPVKFLAGYFNVSENTIRDYINKNKYVNTEVS